MPLLLLLSPCSGVTVPTLTYRDALNQALREEMQRDPDVFLMGEEVGVYQGAYKVSRGLLEEFGPNAGGRHADHRARVRRRRRRRGDGRAAAGHRVHDLELRAAGDRPDRQLGRQDALHVGRPGRVPAVFRGPGGAALQLGAQHSQAFESWYAHIPGLKVVMPATPADAKGLLKSAIRDDDPVVFIEGEMLYNTKGEVPEGEHLVPHRQGRREARGHATSPSSATPRRSAWRSRPRSSSRPRASRPRSSTSGPSGRSTSETILASVAKTHRCVVAEEGWPFAGVGAQVVDVIQREAFDELDAPVVRVTSADVPMPYNKHLEKAAKVDAAKIDRGGRSEVLYR